MIPQNTLFATCLISFGLLSVSTYCVDHVTYVNVDLEDGAISDATWVDVCLVSSTISMVQAHSNPSLPQLVAWA
jgi:hypothetical protein